MFNLKNLTKSLSPAFTYVDVVKSYINVFSHLKPNFIYIDR
jgi:hypothetical protein